MSYQVAFIADCWGQGGCVVHTFDGIDSQVQLQYEADEIDREGTENDYDHCSVGKFQFADAGYCLSSRLSQGDDTEAEYDSNRGQESTLRSFLDFGLLKGCKWYKSTT